MILSDGGILALMQREDDPLIIDPPVNQRQLQPASVELLLGNTLKSKAGKVIDLWKYPNGYPMRPRQFLLGSTIERVHIPADVAAQVNGKSSIGRLGLAIHVTAGFLDPGFKGQVTLELANLSEESVPVHAGQRICQLLFMPMDAKARRPYGSAGLGSHYQDQVGPTLSRS